MDPDLSFEDVLARLRQRDENAANLVYSRFAGRLIGLAHNRLEPRIRHRIEYSSAWPTANSSWATGTACGAC